MVDVKSEKISFFLGSMGRGGAERVISILSRNFAEKGWITQVGLLLFNKIDYKLDSSTQIFDFSGDVKSRIARIPYWLIAIRSFVKREQPKIIVSFAARINILVLLATLGLHAKVIISERNDPIHDGRGFFTRCLVRLLYPFAYKIVFQTRRSFQYFPKRIQKKGIVIPNPISVSCFALSEKKKKIVSVGRLTKQKNHFLLIKAFAFVRKKFPRYELYIYGDGELHDELVMLTQKLGIEKYVHFEGNISNIHEMVADAELFVLSSNYEGLSNALLEAMMMGIPCISTNVAGSDEFIENGKNGILVPVGDLNAMCVAMETLIKDKSLQQTYSDLGRETLKGCNTKNVLYSWEKLVV